MSDGDDTPDEDEAGEPGAADEADAPTDEAETTAEEAETTAEEETELSTATLDARLDEAEEALEAAETEADLDGVEAQLDEVAADLEAADLPEPEDEDEADPAAELEERLDSLRGDLEDARGPYAEDVTSILEDAESTLTDSEWTEAGESEAVAAVESFLESAGDVLGETYAVDDETPEAAAETLGTVQWDVSEADLDPDDDADSIAALLEAAETLADDLEAAEVWSDLTIREQLDAQGFYDVLTPQNRKDFPPEWSAIKIYAQEGEPEPILTALEKYESDFMEENILNALARFAPTEAFEPLHARAERRDTKAIRILGFIGDDRACDTLVDFLGGGDVKLEKTTLRALGAIGNQETTQAVADRLAADDPGIRSTAARALGMLGDTRAIDPLADVLHEDDADEVRASAAWALNQVGTQAALDVVADFAGDRSYVVQAEAEKATGA